MTDHGSQTPNANSASDTNDGSRETSDTDGVNDADATDDTSVADDPTDANDVELKTGTDPTDEEVVRTAAAAAEGVVLDRYKQSRLRDFDVTVRFEKGVLDADVYVNPPADADIPGDRVADEAARAARDAVDDLLGE